MPLCLASFNPLPSGLAACAWVLCAGRLTQLSQAPCERPSVTICGGQHPHQHADGPACVSLQSLLLLDLQFNPHLQHPTAVLIQMKQPDIPLDSHLSSTGLHNPLVTTSRTILAELVSTPPPPPLFLGVDPPVLQDTSLWNCVDWAVGTRITTISQVFTS